MTDRFSNPLKNLMHDIPAGLVVFLVAIPLCLGIAMASGASMFSGIVSGVVGGIVVGTLSGSHVSVSGPAAGLTTIVLVNIEKLGAFETFLCAVIIAGVLQVLLGFLKAGTIGNFFPSSVIKGMLAAIGIILILKQIPHALGYDRDFEGDEGFIQPDGENTLTELISAWNYLSPGAILICLLSFFVLISWEKSFIKKRAWIRLLPAPLIVVVFSILINTLFINFIPQLAISKDHLVSLPSFNSVKEFGNHLSFPDFSSLLHVNVYIVGLTIAVVASLESLLSIEAGDQLDVYKRKTPLDRELKAQGVGNMVSGLLGGLPITSVIVRSSVNVSSGAKTKASAITHGFLLLIAVFTIPQWLNLIPLSALASILIITGYKLANPSIFKSIFSKGWSQFLPFLITIIAIVFTDLLIGIGIGLIVGLYFVLRSNFNEAISLTNDDDLNYLLKLNKDVSFLNKSVLRKALDTIPNNATLIIDGGNTQFIDHDIIETLENFQQHASIRNIEVEIKKNSASRHHFFNHNN